MCVGNVNEGTVWKTKIYLGSFELRVLGWRESVRLQDDKTVRQCSRTDARCARKLLALTCQHIWLISICYTSEEEFKGTSRIVLLSLWN